MPKFPKPESYRETPQRLKFKSTTSKNRSALLALVSGTLPKTAIVRDPNYLNFIRLFRCFICEILNVRQRTLTAACHVTEHGLEIKASELRTLPGCNKHHAELDANPKDFEKRYSVNLRAAVLRYHDLY